MTSASLVASAARALRGAAFARPLAPVRSAAAPLLRATYYSPWPVLVTRYELAALLNRRRLLGVGFEIGVREGEFSRYLLAHWRGCLLVSVDPWSAAPPTEYRDIANVDQERHDSLYEKTRDRLQRFGARSRIWRMTSSDAAPRVLPASADFVYIDARHDHASVLEDLGKWYPKVRPGGIIAGHDYVDGEFAEGVFGVKSAVNDFFSARGLRVSHTIVDRPWVSWVVSVPADARHQLDRHG